VTSSDAATLGQYTITSIKPGVAYKVREEAQAGWTCSFPNVAADLAVKPVVSTACWYEETFTSGVTERNNDFGNWTTASKTGMKFEDLDADGVKDAVSRASAVGPSSSTTTTTAYWTSVSLRP